MLVNTMTSRVRAEAIYRFHRPRRVLFDHLPKCAGTTVSRYLSRHFPTRVTFATDGEDPVKSVETFQSMPMGERHRYELVVGHLTNDLLSAVHPNTIAVTVLRDPVERIASHYRYVLETPPHYLHDRASQLSLGEYASSGLSDELTNWYTAHFSGLSVEDVADDPIAAAHDAAEVITRSYSVVGFQDDMRSFFAALRSRANLWLSPPKLRLNQSSGQRTVDTVTADAIEAASPADILLYALLRS